MMEDDNEKTRPPPPWGDKPIEGANWTAKKYLSTILYFGLYLYSAYAEHYVY